MLSLWLGAYDQGLAYAGLALGTYLTLRVLNFPDLTVDGSFALGGGAAAMLINEGVPVPLSLAMAVFFGFLAGGIAVVVIGPTNRGQAPRQLDVVGIDGEDRDFAL